MKEYSYRMRTLGERLIQTRVDSIAAVLEYIDAIEPDNEVRLAGKGRIADMMADQEWFDVETLESLCDLARQDLGKN